MKEKLLSLFWRIWPLSKLGALLDEVELLRQVTGPKILSMSADERGAWEMRLKSDVVPIIAGALAKWFDEIQGPDGKGNYIEAGLDRRPPPKASMEVGEFTLTVQRRFKPTPNDLKMKAEAEAKLARSQAQALRVALGHLRVDANRLCDRQLGGTYEDDCRKTIAEADRVLQETS